MEDWAWDILADALDYRESGVQWSVGGKGDQLAWWQTRVSYTVGQLNLCEIERMEHARKDAALDGRRGIGRDGVSARDLLPTRSASRPSNRVAAKFRGKGSGTLPDFPGP